METKKWTRGSRDAWLDQFCICPNRRGQSSCSQSSFCPDTWVKSALAMRKTSSVKSSGIKSVKTYYAKEAIFDLVGESDADWSGYVKDRKSTTGYFFKLNGHCAALSWVVKKQTTVAVSSSEAENWGMTTEVREA